MSNIVSFSGANLPSVASLTTALRNIQADVGPTGTVILKCDKTGHWVYGADQTEVEDESLWAVNPYSFVHGFIAWGAGEVLGERMVSVAEPLPDTGPAPAAATKGWEMQVGMSLRCVSGEDEGLEVRYTTTSVGGKRAVQELAVKIAEKVGADPTKPVPLVALKRDHYQHKTYGRIYTPVFDVRDWASMNGETAVEAETAATEEAPETAATEEAPRRRRRVE